MRNGGNSLGLTRELVLDMKKAVAKRLGRKEVRKGAMKMWRVDGGRRRILER